jgi:hypothetical protein
MESEQLLAERKILQNEVSSGTGKHQPVSRWVKRAIKGPDPARRWPAFLRNHREAIAAMDFSPCRL